jgi:hypothetical protein
MAGVEQRDPALEQNGRDPGIVQRARQVDGKAPELLIAKDIEMVAGAQQAPLLVGQQVKQSVALKRLVQQRGNMFPLGKIIKDAQIRERGDVAAQATHGPVGPVIRQAAAKDEQRIGFGCHRLRPSLEIA